VLGGGCFWCLEAVFEQLAGVHTVVPGYAGGTSVAPTYEEVCSGGTGHAEVVRVTFDPDVVPYARLLDVFFSIHDPTSLNRQGADVGTQYRSVIFYESAAQETTAREMVARLDQSGLYGGTVVTEIAPLAAFYPAEEYHRQYFRRHPERAYCQAVVAPKVSKFRKQYREALQGA